VVAAEDRRDRLDNSGEVSIDMGELFAMVSSVAAAAAIIGLLGSWYFFNYKTKEGGGRR